MSVDVCSLFRLARGWPEEAPRDDVMRVRAASPPKSPAGMGKGGEGGGGGGDDGGVRRGCGVRAGALVLGCGTVKLGSGSHPVSMAAPGTAFLPQTSQPVTFVRCAAGAAAAGGHRGGAARRPRSVCGGGATRGFGLVFPCQNVHQARREEFCSTRGGRGGGAGAAMSWRRARGM